MFALRSVSPATNWLEALAVRRLSFTLTGESGQGYAAGRWAVCEQRFGGGSKALARQHVGEDDGGTYASSRQLPINCVDMVLTSTG